MLRMRHGSKNGRSMVKVTGWFTKVKDGAGKVRTVLIVVEELLNAVDRIGDRLAGADPVAGDKEQKRT